MVANKENFGRIYGNDITNVICDIAAMQCDGRLCSMHIL